MSQAQSLWPDSPPFTLPQHVPSLLYRTVLNPAIHGQEDSLVDWLNNVLSQVMSPTPSLRSEVQRLHLCSYHQGEQVSVRRTIYVTATPVSSEVNEREIMEMFASPQLMQKREASAAPAIIQHSNRESSMSGTSRIPSAGRPTKRTGVMFRLRKSTWLPGTAADVAAEGEEAALSRLSEAITSWRAKESDTVRSTIWDEYAGVKDLKCRHDPPRIDRQIHFHRLELQLSNQIFENSRREQVWL